jgi:branched-chain amino acid transport system permease protein
VSEPGTALTVAEPGPTPGGRHTDAVRAPARRPRPGAVAAGVLLAVALVLPFYVDSSWLRMGLFASAAAVAALGLSLLMGQAGQLSLGHSFFAAVGAYGYTYLAAEPDGLGLPPAVALVLAVVLAGIAGLMFSPISARLRGIYLGVASLGLVFLGLHVLDNAETLTGGAHGRNVPPFALPGFVFDRVPGQKLLVLGVPFGKEEKLWYLALAILVAGYLYFRNLVRARPGRALRAVRDRDLMAGILGVPVTRYKAYAFVVSSMYAGLGGVLLALVLGRIVPDGFGVTLAIEYLAMVVIGGAGSAAGTIAGAVFVICLPRLLDRYAEYLPGIASSSSIGSGGIDPFVAAQFAYGGVLILLLLVEPGGLAALGNRLVRRGR